MALAKIGLEAVMKMGDFTTGMNKYNAGVKEMDAKTYTSDEVCQLLRVSKNTLYEMIREAIIRPCGWQKRPFIFPIDEVDRVLKSNVIDHYHKEEKHYELIKILPSKWAKERERLANELKTNKKED